MGEDEDDEYNVQEIVPREMKKIMDLKDLSAIEDLTAQMETFELQKEEEQANEAETSEAPAEEEEEDEEDDDEYNVQEIVPQEMKKIMDLKDLSAIEDLTAQMETF